VIIREAKKKLLEKASKFKFVAASGERHDGNQTFSEILPVSFEKHTR
jgi:hypothetical protein